MDPAGSTGVPPPASGDEPAPSRRRPHRPVQLHRVDPTVAFEDQIGVLKQLQDEGKIRHIGLSQVSIAEMDAAQQIVPIATVQNLYNLTTRDDEALVDYAEQHNIGFIPWFPLATGALSGDGSPLADIAAEKGASASQIALAWLLRRSPVMLPIPGTSSVAHLEDNVAGATVALTDDEYARIEAATRS